MTGSFVCGSAAIFALSTILGDILSVVRLIKRFFELTADDRCLLVQAFALQTAIAVGLRVLRFDVLRRLVDGSSGSRVDHPVDLWHTGKRVARAVAVSSRYLGTASTCLTEALAATVLLDRRGCPSHIAIGVRLSHQASFKAHAWVEVRDSVVLGDPAPGEFVRFATLEVRRSMRGSGVPRNDSVVGGESLRSSSPP